MKILLVDDEPLALIGLKTMLEKELDDIMLSTCSNPKEVMANVVDFNPEVVFLDIHMPEIDGLQLGMEIQVIAPGTEIIFVTSYDQYAVRAFELYALDYILKPVQQTRLQQTIMRVKDRLHQKNERKKSVADAPIIRCFKEIRFQLHGKKEEQVKWRTSKALELFAYLLHHRDRMIDRSVLLELLWPEIEEEKAIPNLYTTMYYIRKTLKKYDMDMVAIRVGELGTGYRLDLGTACVEMEVWEHDLKQLGRINASNALAYERVLEWFCGDYLGDYDFIWAEHERERLRLLWLHHMKQLGEFYEQQEMLEKAVLINYRLQRIFPELEESYFSLMKLYHKLGNPSGVEEQYMLLTRKMESEMELPISVEITKWYEQWRSREAKFSNLENSKGLQKW